ncbi:MFS transporter [Burkholderia diffusa]|uniref:MFS transporter n=2 Tax=Burkholderia diffusa TaxID=488732 RepID=A0AAW3PIL2_9BURK|nr:MFS transporter [Burkholderia diffusa]KWF36868.1 MFS transporter [Burkholderia diffusa]KWF42592.1 MFS transporter [Burkholderia diffusa]KWF48364.1 MFS transporter [Burkholderia diffusa]KWF55645.1 MFS transporter [Burkholderia diffusa]
MSMSNINTAAATKTPAKAALAAWIGSAMEYYDFFIYGTAAALVFGKVFFPGSSPSMGLLLALATFGVGYVARPVGAFFLGHIGDKFGRKRVLVLTLVLMGASTFLVGCLPTYGHVGMLAPTLLVLLRLCQGFSASGEQAGANSMSLEHAPSNRRAFFTSFTLSGTQAGLILATAVFLPISRLPEDQLLSWGWRIPFWLSAFVVLIGYLIRRNLNETPVFEHEQRTRHVARMPLAVLFKHYSGDVLRVVLCALVSTVSTIFGVFALSYAVNVIKIDRGTMLWVAILTNIVALVAIPLFATLADRIGRKPVYLLGIIGPALLMFPYLWSIEQQNIPLIFLFGVLMSGVAYSASNGIWPSFFAEMFDTRVRLSGMAIGTQIGFALAGFAPTIAAAMMKTGPGAWVPVAWFVAGACAVAAGSTLTARETYNVKMDELGRKKGSPVVKKAPV